MIHRTHGDITFECDLCSDLLDTDCDDWDTAWAMAKREAWTSRKVAGEWNHYCPDCKQ